MSDISHFRHDYGIPSTSVLFILCEEVWIMSERRPKLRSFEGNREREQNIHSTEHWVMLKLSGLNYFRHFQKLLP